MTRYPRFPAGDSQAGRTLMQIDWGASTLGPVDQWPAALKTHLNLILNSPESMYLLWGPDLLFFHNDAYAPILGPRLGTAMGARIEELWADVWDQVLPYAQNALRGIAYQCEDLPLTMARYGEIEHTWWSFSFSPLIDENNQVVGMFCVTNETTRRVLDQRALEASEQRRLELMASTAELNCLWDISPDLLAMVDFNGLFLRVNPAWSTVLGYQPDELVGTHVMGLAHPDDLRPTESALSQAIGGVLPLFENRYRHKDGSYRWIGWTAAPDNGLIFALGKDMTAEKERAAALRAAEEALRQSQKMEAVGQLTGGLAHDFNNLLMGISGNIELLKGRVAKGKSEHLERYIDSALEGSRRAAALTHRLLAFSRRQTLDPKPTNVDQLVSGMAELIGRTVGPGIAMDVIATPGLWPTLVDLHQLENALLNLCLNARDAMPDGGQLLIETCNKQLQPQQARELELPAGRYVALCVSDNGSGMTEEVVKRAFDPFFTTKPIGMGTGLGLSMIYGFVRQSGGGVHIQSTLGRGSQVCLYLPADTEATPVVSEAPVRVEPFEHKAGGETVLVVDDEPSVRALMTEVLADQGYAVLEAETGAGALRILESRQHIDLLVSDVGLPGGMNGRQLADAARALRVGLKVLFVTGYAENAALGNGRLEPGMHVLTKPFSIPVFSERVKGLLEG